MKKIILYSFLTAFSMVLIQSCGPSQKEKQVQKMNRQSQMAQARQDSIAKAQAEAEAKKREAELEQKQNQGTQSSADSGQTQQPAQQNHQTQQVEQGSGSSQIEFIRGGDYTLQVGSFRSKKVAQKQLDKWKKRGYSHAYIVKHGSDATGNVWFRVRLGVVKTKDMAKQLKQNVNSNYNTQSWISYIGNEQNTKAAK